MRQPFCTFHSSLRFERNEHPAAAFSGFLPGLLPPTLGTTGTTKSEFAFAF
jgi:hypothetical protein